MAGQTALICKTLIRLYMQLNEEKIYISLDLKSPILNVKTPNNVSWLNLINTRIHNDYILKKIKKLIHKFNSQIPWNEELQIDDVEKFLYSGNDINILIKDYDFIGWAWQDKKVTDSDLLEGQIYQSKWFVDKKFLFKKSNKHLSLWWIQELKKFYRRQGFTEGTAYIDSWNKGVLKSVLRAGYKIKK